MSREGDALASGLAWLTGRADGPPLVPPGQAATVAAELGTRVGVADGAALLGERAALSGRGRAAPRSVGGACRAVRCADGWLALSLAREVDRAAVPALTGGGELEAWAVATPVEEALERAVLLELPAGVVGAASGPPVVITRLAPPGPTVERPLVVCLASLWAGPLCASLLGGLGAEVVFVESLDRPDAMRWGDPGLWHLLHAGARTVRIDLRTDLAPLLRRADVVVEGSRPRALEQLGIHPADVLATSPTTWVSLTGHGRDEGHRVGFGDDAAMTGGLVVWGDDGTPWPVGDAVADPLAGLHAAVAAAAALADGGGVLLDVALSRVAASCMGEEPALPAGGAAPPRARVLV